MCGPEHRRAQVGNPVARREKRHKSALRDQADREAEHASQQQDRLFAERLVARIAEKKAELTQTEAALEAETDEAKKQRLQGKIAGYQSEIESLESSQTECRAALNAVREQKNKEAEDASQETARHHKERKQLQKLELNAHAELAEAVERLKGPKAENNSLGQALASLDIAIKALGRIKTVFEDTREYWATVKSHCDDLANVGELELLQDMDEEFAEAITKSWYKWLVLGKINYTAVRTMQGVMANVDGLMNDMPTTQEVQQRLPSMFMRLDIMVAQDGDRLDTAP